MPIVWLIYVLFGLAPLATPPLTVFLLWRQYKLRQQLLKLTDLSIERNDALHRELLELRRQVAVLPRPADSAAPPHPDAAQYAPSGMPPPITKPAAPSISKKPIEPATVAGAALSTEKTAAEISEKREKDAITPIPAPLTSPKPVQPVEKKPAPLAPLPEQKPLPP